MYLQTLLPIYIVMVILGAWAFFTVGGTRHSLKLWMKSCFTCKPNEFIVDD